MKTGLLTLAITGISLAAFAQGKITFCNDAIRLFVLGSTLPADVGHTGQPIPESPLPSGVYLTASLYAGTSSDSLALQTTTTLTGAWYLAPGRMASPALTLTVPGGAPVSFMIVLTDLAATRPGTISGIATPSVTFFDATYFGTSGLFTAVPGTSITYPFINQTTVPVNSTWAAAPVVVNYIPEPSTFALAWLGLSVPFFCRRSR